MLEENIINAMLTAIEASNKSYDGYMNVGCAIANEEGLIISIGHNDLRGDLHGDSTIMN